MRNDLGRKRKKQMVRHACAFCTWSMSSSTSKGNGWLIALVLCISSPRTEANKWRVTLVLYTNHLSSINDWQFTEALRERTLLWSSVNHDRNASMIKPCQINEYKNQRIYFQGTLSFYQIHSYSWQGKFGTESPFLVNTINWPNKTEKNSDPPSL